MLYRQWNKRSLHIYVPIINETVFIFEYLTANPPFWTRLSSVHGRLYQKERACKVTRCNFSERTTSYELCVITPVLCNLTRIKMYPLVRDQAKWSQWPVKMATGHFPNSSRNFAWCGVINHDRMTTLTLQTKYDTTLPSWYPKSAYLLEISFYPSGSGIYSHVVRHLTTASPSAAKRSTVASVLLTLTSARGHVNHVFTIMTLPHSSSSEILIAPEQYNFHSDGERR